MSASVKEYVQYTLDGQRDILTDVFPESYIDEKTQRRVVQIDVGEIIFIRVAITDKFMYIRLYKKRFYKSVSKMNAFLVSCLTL